MTLVPWWCLLVHVMGFHGHIHRHGKSWNGYGFHTYPHPATKPVIPRDIMVDVINDLGLKLLAIHNEYNENNVAISPYGALSVLVALGEGVEGEAIHEIHEATHIPNDISIIRVGLRDIHRHLKSYFIPKEGFLAGLTLNHENVTLRPEYEDILRFYGYDTATFNNALYPQPETTEKPQISSGDISTAQPQTTTEIGRIDAVEMTTQVVTDTTANTDATTVEEIPAVEAKTLLETTTNGITTADTTTSVPQSTTTSLPQTTQDTTTELTTVKTSTTTNLIPEPSTMITTSEASATEESTTIPSTVTTSLSSTPETTLPTTSTTVKPSTTDTDTTTEAFTPSGASSNTSPSVEPLEAGTTTQNTILTTESPSTSITAAQTSTSFISEATDSSTTLSSLLTTTLPSTSSIPETTTDSITTSLLTTTTDSITTSLLTTTTDSITTSLLTTTTDSITTSLSTTTTETATTSDDLDSSSSATSRGDAFLGDNGTLYTSNVDSTSTPLSSSTEMTTSLTTDAITVNTTPNDTGTEKSNKDNEVDSTDSPADGVGFGGVSKRQVRSGATSSNQTNVIKLNGMDALSGGSVDFGFKRTSRSVVDYIIARYHDDQFNFHNSPEPYIPEEPPSFLIYGKYREHNINFMKYNTVLPFHYEPHLDALALSFPLDSTKYYLLLLLPVDESGIDKLICDLRLNGSIKYIIANLQYRHVIATIPSFMLKGYVTLTPSFQKLGIRKVFEPRQADFSQMTNQRGIYVTNIEQAITVTIRNYVDPSSIHHHRNLHRYDPVHFKADHPFLYFVIDSDIHVTLMAGKIVNPLNSRIS